MSEAIIYLGHAAWGVGHQALAFPVLESDQLANVPLYCPSLSCPLFPEEIHVPIAQNKILQIPLSYVA